MAEPFITTEDLEEFMETTGLSEFADFAVEAACEVVRGYLDQLVDGVDDDEIRLDGSGTDVLLLPQRPVLDVTDVTVGDSDPLVPEDDYRLVADLGILYRIGGRWVPGRQNIAVTYSHGYAYEDDVPADIRLVALQVARDVYSSTGSLITGAGGGTVRSVSIGAATVELSDGTTTTVTASLSPEQAGMLSRYALRRVG